MNILLPTVDWSGAGPGYVESEFPLFPYLVAGLYRLFGVEEALGRALAILFAAGAGLYLARLCGRYIDRTSAGFAAAAFSILPICSYIGAAFMPESLMLMASVAAIDHMDRWSSGGRERDRWISAGWLAIAIAVKLPELFLGIPIFYIVWRRLGWRMLLRPDVWLCAALALVPPGLWYLHAHRLQESTGLTFGIWEMGSDKWANLGLLGTPSFYLQMLFSRLIERHLAFAGAALVALGMFMLRARHDLGTFHWWLGGGVFYLLVVAKGNAVHDYYQLPLLPPVSLWIGAAIGWTLRSDLPRWRGIGARVLVLAFVALSLLRVPHFLRRERSSMSLVAAGAHVQAIVPPGKLVITVDEGDPTLLYHVHRRGWHASVATLTHDWVEARRREGAAYVVSRRDRLALPEAAPALAMLRRSYPDRSMEGDVHVFDLAHPLTQAPAPSTAAEK